MAGVLRILPFTGITLPFMAYGAHSLFANYVVVRPSSLIRRSSGSSLIAGASRDGEHQPPATKKTSAADPP
jgi:hypothetical protein